MKVFVTGASGFLGKYMLDELLSKGHEVFALSRQTRDSLHPKLTWVKGDLSHESSVGDGNLAEAIAGTDLVIHAAALYDLKAGHEELYRHNVLGTANLIHLMRQLAKMPHLAHISTIAIAGDSSTNFDENKFDVGQSFKDPYSSTKFASEAMVRSADDIPSKSIYRMGIIVGSTIDGRMDRIDGPYYLQELIRKFRPIGQNLGRMRIMPFPYNECTRLYLIPVDIAAKLVVDLSLKVQKKKGTETFHVIGGGRGVSARRTLQTMLAYYKIPLNPLAIPKRLTPNALFRAVGTPENSVSYINTKWTFSSKNLEKELPDFRYPSFTFFSDKLMDYAEQHFFQKGR